MLVNGSCSVRGHKALDVKLKALGDYANQTGVMNTYVNLG